MAHNDNPLRLVYSNKSNSDSLLTSTNPTVSSSGISNTLDIGTDAKLVPYQTKVLKWLQDNAADIMKDPGRASPVDLKAALQKAISPLQLPRVEADMLYDQVYANLVGGGALEPYFRDPSISEIMVVGPKIFIERDGVIEAGIPLSSTDASIRLAQQICRHVRQDYTENQPLMNLTWPEDGSRINITHHKNAPTGVVITIRKRNQEHTLDIPDFIEGNMLNQDAANLLIDAVQGKLNMIIAGPTGSGKTSVLRAIASAGIHPRERVLVLEDTEELRLNSLPHMINLIGHPDALTAAQMAAGEVTLQDMFRNALRMRPDRIIMGELRGAEAFDFIEAGLTETGGMMTTIHIRQPEMLNARLYWIANKNHMNIPLSLIESSIFQSTDMIVQVERDGNGHRHLSRIVETLQNGTLRDLFKWDADKQSLQYQNQLTPVKLEWVTAHKTSRIGAEDTK